LWDDLEHGRYESGGLIDNLRAKRQGRGVFPPGRLGRTGQGGLNAHLG